MIHVGYRYRRCHPKSIYTRDRNRKMDGFFARIVLRLPDATAVIGDVVPNSAIQNQ